MDTQLPDPTDWVDTPLAPLSDVDALLRCQICKDFYTSAVLTTCAHTFCSLCIRRCLSADGKCPSCRAPEQESRLRRNGVLQEVVDAFTGQRTAMLDAARQCSGIAEEKKTSTTIPSKDGRAKRKRQEMDAEAVDEEPPARRTRSQRVGAARSSQRSSKVYDGNVIEIESNDEDTPASTASTSARRPSREPEDGLVACPMCGRRMKEELVFPHLDNCNGEPPPSASTSKPIPFPVKKQSSTLTEVPSRLPQLSYNLLKDNALRKKMEDLKIPSSGPRGLLIRRHQEWLALWNANCDSNRPRSRQELLKELDAWERSQGGRSVNGGAPGGGIKSKEFESEEYGRRHNDEFTDLIAQARASRAKKVKVEPSKEQDKPDKDDTAFCHQEAQVPLSHPLETTEDPSMTQAPSESQPLPAPPVESPFRRGFTAPPSTGPLKVSRTLHKDQDACDSVVSSPTLNKHMPALTHTASAPLPHDSVTNAKRRHVPSIHTSIAATDFAPSPVPPASAPATAAPGRRPSLSQARSSPHEPPPPPATHIWSGSSGSSRRSSLVDGLGSASGGAARNSAPRTMHMFNVPAEPILDSDLDFGSR